MMVVLHMLYYCPVYLETMNIIIEIPSKEVTTHNQTWNSRGSKKENRCVSFSFPFLYSILMPIKEINKCMFISYS